MMDTGCGQMRDLSLSAPCTLIADELPRFLTGRVPYEADSTPAESPLSARWKARLEFACPRKCRQPTKRFRPMASADSHASLVQHRSTASGNSSKRCPSPLGKLSVGAREPRARCRHKPPPFACIGRPVHGAKAPTGCATRLVKSYSLSEEVNIAQG